MGRLRDHRPRFDSTVCPDRAACVRLYHPTLEHGDQCECCGDRVEDPAPAPRGVEVTLRLSKSEAQAILRSQGFTNGYGVRKSVALQAAEAKVIGAVSAGLTGG